MYWKGFDLTPWSFKADLKLNGTSKFEQILPSLAQRIWAFNLPDAPQLHIKRATGSLRKFGKVWALADFPSILLSGFVALDLDSLPSGNKQGAQASRGTS